MNSRQREKCVLRRPVYGHIRFTCLHTIRTYVFLKKGGKLVLNYLPKRHQNCLERLILVKRMVSNMQDKNLAADFSKHSKVF